MATETPVSNRTHKTPSKGYGQNIAEIGIQEEIKSEDEFDIWFILKKVQKDSNIIIFYNMVKNHTKW